MKQQLSEKLKERKEQHQQLLGERQKLLNAQAGLLKDYVMAGVALPVDQPNPSTAAERRQQLIAQLTQEEGAARAALEALKQGSSLAKAREIGEKVLRQQHELAGLNQSTVPTAVDPQSALLQAEPAAEQPQAAGGSTPAAVHAVHTTRVAFSKHPHGPRHTNAAAIDVANPPRSPVVSSWHDDLDNLSYADTPVGRQTRQPGSQDGSRPQQRQQQPAAASGSGAEPPSYIQELQAQVASLQAMLASQARPPFPAMANPWEQVLPAVTAAAMLGGNNPAVAAAALAAAGQQAAGLGTASPWFGLPGAGALHGLPPDMLAADPSLAAAVKAHARDMALLKMDVEKTRTAAELQQIKAQLAASLQQQPSAPDYLSSGRRVTGVQQQQQQQPLPLQDNESQEAADDTAVQPADSAADDHASMQHKLSDDDGWLDGMAAGSEASLPPMLAASAAEDEALALEEASAVLAAKGANADTDVLQVNITTVGPFSRRGTYRVCVALYEGYQPVECAPGQQVTASTSKRLVTPPGTTAGSTGTADADVSNPANAVAAAAASGIARFNESLSLKGVVLSSSTQLVFELYMAKPGLAGLPTKEALVGWASVPLLQGGQLLPGVQSLPLFRLPLMLSAQRKFTYDSALLDFRVARYKGAPGDTDLSPEAAAARAGLGQAAAGHGTDHEDIPGVPSQAWVRVQRGVPPADPYTPGDGLVVVVDAARFLPCSTTITRVLGGVWSSNGTMLAKPFEGVAHPDSDAYNPRFACTATLGANFNNTRFEDATATLILQVQTIERTSRTLRVVGFASLPLFLDPKAGGQPVSRSMQDYVLNQGAFQIPLHAGTPSATGPLRASSLDDVPRLPCASLLVRIMTPEAAKLARRKPAPAYAERVYDTVSRALPTPLERVLFAKVLSHRSWGVREAARLVAWLRRQPGGLSGRRVGSGSRRGTSDAKANGSGGNVGLLARVFIGGSDDDAATAAAAAHLNVGDPAAAIQEQAQDLEAAQAEPLPPSDPEIMDWMADLMAEAEQSALGNSPADSALGFINLNTGYEYSPELGFFVALDGAARLARLLPTAGLVSYSPPGSLYQDHPLVDDVKCTLDYDMDAPLAAPRWLDGYQQFASVQYHPSLVLLIDIRAVLPGSVSSAPQGWACLPVFEPAGKYVASGTYQLPLFQGIPSYHLLKELEASGDADAVMAEAIKSGRVRPSLECSSVLVRLMCGSRQGQLEAPAWSMALQDLRVPRYVISELGAHFVADMRKMIKNKTYSMVRDSKLQGWNAVSVAKPKNLTDEQFMDQINDTLIKVAGLDATLEGGDSGDEGEGSETLATGAVGQGVLPSAGGAGLAGKAAAKDGSVVAARRVIRNEVT